MSKSIDNILDDQSLFIIPIKGKEHSLLYAPLADSVLLLEQKEVDRIRIAITTPQEADEEALSIVEALCDVIPVTMRENQIRNENDFINLSILPNNICNFSCSYCYSAKGRSSQQLSLQSAYKAIDYFLSTERNKAPKLTVSIFGGGEPLLSWKNVVKPAIEYLYEQAAVQSRTVITTVITNGSLLPDGFIKLCRKYSIDLVCSFEILEDVQNSQRKHYETVCSNIRALINNGVVPAINSVITELNVDRQPEMIAELHLHYPEVKYVALEPVVNPQMADKENFYIHFIGGFFAAERLAEKYGIKLSCSALRNVDVTVDRYCPGEFALCANGEISCCPCVSSPQDPNYNRYVYGIVDENGVTVDKTKLQTLLGYNLHSQSWCENCFAKWNCGGGCVNNTLNNGGKQDIAYCRFVKRFLIYTLLKRLDKIYREEENINLQEILGSYEHVITE